MILLSCMDIAEFIKQFEGAYIIMKMNCEGAEYDIIPHMAGCDVLSWIDKFYIQWHWDKIGLSRFNHDIISGMVTSYAWNAQFNADKFKNEFLKTL